jgi:hypothetical protein
MRLVANWKDLEDSPEGPAAEREFDASLEACLTAVYELTLIAPGKVTAAGYTALNALKHYRDDDGASLIKGIVELVDVMRADLGERIQNVNVTAVLFSYESTPGESFWKLETDKFAYKNNDGTGHF